MDEQRELFDGAFLPTTLSIGFLRAPLREVVAGFLEWHERSGTPLRSVKLPGGFRESAPRLQPLVYRGQSKFLIVQSEHPGWCAFFDDGANGSYPTSALVSVAQILRVAGVELVCARDVPACDGRPARMGARMFSLVRPDPREGALVAEVVRSIAVARESRRWVFQQSGTPLDFEDRAASRKCRIPERLSFPMLASYAGHLGLEAFRDDFYRGPGELLIRRVRRRAAGAPAAESYATAQKRLGMDR